MRVAVMGMGSWGTAFGMVLADAGNDDVVVWGRRAELAEAITRTHKNPDFHPGIELPPALWATTDPATALHGAELVVVAVPAQSLRENLSGWRELVPPGAVLVSLMKGLEVGTLLRMSEVMAEVTGRPPEQLAVVSGPNLAREVALRQPTASVVACADEAVAALLQQACMTPYFRPYTNTDVVGVELGGVVKNVIALATGMAEGMGFGDNSKAAIITRGLAEMTRLGLAMGADAMTFMGLAGIGDLVATCMSPLSRNRTFGENLGRGMSVDEVVAITLQTAEGVKSSPAVLELARRTGVDMPIAEHVSAVVHDDFDPRDMVRALMTRVAKPEWEGGE
jgi:glycerol-3-phosphate dehydrogenase (NAD(P)+)